VSQGSGGPESQRSICAASRAGPRLGALVGRRRWRRILSAMGPAGMAAITRRVAPHETQYGR